MKHNGRPAPHNRVVLLGILSLTCEYSPLIMECMKGCEEEKTTYKRNRHSRLSTVTINRNRNNKTPIVHNFNCHPRPPEYVFHRANTVAWSGTFIWSHRHAWKMLLLVTYYHLFTEGKSKLIKKSGEWFTRASIVKLGREDIDSAHTLRQIVHNPSEQSAPHLDPLWKLDK